MSGEINMSTLAYAEPQPIAYDLDTAARVSSLGKTRLYELIQQGRLVSTKIGKRRLVMADSLHRLIQEGC
ncbi:excisionase family DNA binding protein [Novosphingobium sp. SG751A]|uniref:helix-turn-helix domain-containing protein n=1 Tax=Novosphingobium sp. SG751A TaxID=2587000 RepID=UPI00155809C7|nr:helix-turn-helix domain-containing protein [Novosphingobium sp. SG751A]NOW45700.1 excisionase family DNA binding protein [Novosphingobium sp. SG751A]